MCASEKSAAASFCPLSPAIDLITGNSVTAGERVGVRGPYRTLYSPHPGPLPTVTFCLKAIEKEKRRVATVAKYATVRAELKKKGDYIGLSLLPRDASPVRLSKRCLATGRKRAYIGRFKLSRIAFRELASNGYIPGVTKSSW